MPKAQEFQYESPKRRLGMNDEPEVRIFVLESGQEGNSASIIESKILKIHSRETAARADSVIL